MVRGAFQASLVSLACFCFSTDILQAQNLVPNPSFENYNSCPGDMTNAYDGLSLIGWKSANRGTPDHFHSCSNGEADVPHNWAGTSDAYEGRGYAGIFLVIYLDHQYQEYLECKLTQALIKDSTYHIEFHYKLASYSRYSIDRIGLLLTDTLIINLDDPYISIKPTIDVIRDSAITPLTGSWESVSLNYKAKGGEDHLVIGNFYGTKQTNSYRIQFKAVANEIMEFGSYYYIDDVKLIPKYILDLEKSHQVIPEFELPTVAVNTNYILKNIQFELNSYKLVPSSFEELDKVATYLRKNPRIRVQLFGHTDDQGTDSYNLRLSENRANTVATYLASSGISAKRIEAFGYGENKPLVEGTSETARTTNRRVEIRFLE